MLFVTYDDGQYLHTPAPSDIALYHACGNPIPANECALHTRWRGVTRCVRPMFELQTASYELRWSANALRRFVVTSSVRPPHGTVKRRQAGWVFGVCVIVMLPFATAMPARAFELTLDDPLVHTHADLAIVSSLLPPSTNDPRWRRVQLPESWRPEQRYRQGIEGWYRFRIANPASTGAPSEPWSVYLWRFSMNAAVYFNGELIGSGGRFAEPIARNWNRPLLFAIPRSAWRADRNEVLVRLRVYPGFGHMTPIAVGPSSDLAPDHDARFLRQITLNQIAAGVMLMVGIGALALWRLAPTRSPYPYLAVASLCWFVYAANQFVQDIPVSAAAWWWLVHATIDWFSVAIVCFIHRVTGENRKTAERFAVALALVFSLCYASWSLPELARYNPVTHGVMLLFALQLFGWLVRMAWTTRAREYVLFAGVLAVMLVAGVYDSILNALLVPHAWLTASYAMPLTVPLAFVLLIGHIAIRLAGTMRALAEANEQLETRVRAASAELERGYVERGQLLVASAQAEERDRIYRDLHDDLGAKLLSMVYSAREETQVARARDALDTMRTIVGTAALHGGPLGELADELRVEAELRCEDAGMRLSWSQYGDTTIGARMRYQLDHILRELVSNAIEHAEGTCLDVRLDVDDRSLTLQVRDNGKGLPADQVLGPGMLGVRGRAADVGGSAVWRAADTGGCEVRVVIPLRAAPQDNLGASDA